jgi:hypothetical protein
MGWPPSIPINCEGQRIGSMVNPQVGVLMVRPYQLTSKYPHYKKDEI